VLEDDIPLGAVSAADFVLKDSVPSWVARVSRLRLMRRVSRRKGPTLAIGGPMITSWWSWKVG